MSHLMSTRQLSNIMNNEKLKQLLELRTNGHSMKEACEVVGVVYATGVRWINAYLRANPFGAAEELRGQMLDDLMRVQATLEAKIERKYVKVAGGSVVYVPAVGEDGNVVMEQNPQTGKLEPVMIALEDEMPQNDAIGLYLKLMDRKAKLLGLDIPPPKEAPKEDDPQKEQQASRDAALVRAVIAGLDIKRMVRGSDVVDVVPVDLSADPIVTSGS